MTVEDRQGGDSRTCHPNGESCDVCLGLDALPTIANSKHGTLFCVPREVVAVVDMAAQIARRGSPLDKAVRKARRALR